MTDLEIVELAARRVARILFSETPMMEVFADHVRQLEIEREQAHKAALATALPGQE